MPSNAFVSVLLIDQDII